MEKLLTIVIPTYNMEVYLERCLNSLILSDSQMEFLEVLVINDGSKDRSLEIGRNFELQFPGTFRVIDKENGNYGSCVNRGLKEARGKYIKVLDADDWFDNNEFSVYLNELVKFDVDLILTPFTTVNVETNSKSQSVQNILHGQVNDFNSFPLNKICRYSMHMITYRTEFLRIIGYKQTEGISYTDTEWTHLPQYSIKNFVYLSYSVYQYMVGREGQTMDPSVLAKNIWKYEVISKSLIENRKESTNRIDTLAEEFNLQQIEFLASSIFRMLLVLVKPTSEDLEHLKLYDKYLRQECPFVYDKLDKLIVKKYLPLKYVRFWRVTGFRFPVDFLRKKYRKIRYGK